MLDGWTTLTLRVNGEERPVVFPTHHTLLEVLREECGLTGTKHGCELGESPPPTRAATAPPSTIRAPSARCRCGTRRNAVLRLPAFSFRRPASVAEAAAILAGEGPDARLVAGGTDLWPNMKRRHQQADNTDFQAQWRGAMVEVYTAAALREATGQEPPAK